MVNVIVLRGNGINCENETAKAFSSQETSVQIVHVNELINKDFYLKDFDILAIPGGFSYGDEIQSGKIMALKLKKHLIKDLKQFIESKKLIIGICNGFQILTQLDLFSTNKREFSLTTNNNNKFINRWEEMDINLDSLWTKNFPKSYAMPVRHAQGKLILKNKISSDQIIFRYKNDINGSTDQIAGITNPQGNVLGIMPHPEAALNENLIPSTQKPHPLFENAINYIKETFYA